jgi:hypothetical protein
MDLEAVPRPVISSRARVRSALPGSKFAGTAAFGASSFEAESLNVEPPRSADLVKSGALLAGPKTDETSPCTGIISTPGATSGTLEKSLAPLPIGRNSETPQAVARPTRRHAPKRIIRLLLIVSTPSLSVVSLIGETSHDEQALAKRLVPTEGLRVARIALIFEWVLRCVRAPHVGCVTVVPEPGDSRPKLPVDDIHVAWCKTDGAATRVLAAERLWRRSNVLNCERGSWRNDDEERANEDQ